MKHIDNSRLRREVDPEKWRDCLCLLALGFLVFVSGLLIAVQHFQCLRFGYQIEQLKAQRLAAEEWNHHLRLQHASLADPQRIDRLARKEIGLAPPEPQQVIALSDRAKTPTQAVQSELARNFSVASRDPSCEQ